jgi:hypothetical protein
MERWYTITAGCNATMLAELASQQFRLAVLKTWLIGSPKECKGRMRNDRVNSVPPDLLAVLPKGTASVAEQWWASLSESERLRISGLWDERLEVCFFSPQADAAGCVDGWEQVPVVRGGRFVPRDKDVQQERGAEFIERLLSDPNLVLAYESPHRTFHIGCTKHEAARACIASGFVPVDFVCPGRSISCPLLPLRGSRLTLSSTS